MMTAAGVREFGQNQKHTAKKIQKIRQNNPGSFIKDGGSIRRMDIGVEIRDSLSLSLYIYTCTRTYTYIHRSHVLRAYKDVDNGSNGASLRNCPS